REYPLPPGHSLAGAEVDMQRYEAERPSAAAACRIGDGRVLACTDYTVVPRPCPLDPDALRVDVDHRGKY
ncbi:MAG TPA: HyaD/HybD family hydrogenase maturation endopeptidase, partial [Gammaproteobacteria bacterium]|nr:HyaD/HybD family hydrogenase maturation endopeptidase [Gammaproteobacteria bacterium]